MASTGNPGPLTPEEFDRFRHAAETYREDLVVSLAGLVGLRPAEISRLRTADLQQYRRDGTPCYLLTVREDDEETTRMAYVPRDVAHDLRKFCNTHSRDPNDPVFDVSARRIQMLISTVSEQTATDRLQSVSSRDLRRSFAYRLLVEQEVHPRIVQTVGGWSSLERLEDVYDDPTEADILEACADASARLPPTDKTSASRTRSGPADVGTLDGEFTRRTDELVACLAELGTHLAEAATHEDIVTAACTALATCFEGVWFCTANGEPRESAGTSGISSTTIRDRLAETNASETLTDASEATVVIHEGSTAYSDSTWDGEELCVVAVQSSEKVHGFLCVTDEAFDATSQRVLADVGRRVGQTLVALERKQLLHADTGVELTVQSSASESVFVDVSNKLGCQFELEGVVPVQSASLLHFVTVSGVAVGDVLDTVDDIDQVTDARLVRDYGDEALLEFVISGPALASTVVENGGSVRTLTVTEGTARLTAVFSRHVDVREVFEQFTAAFPDSHLRSKREVEEPVQTTARVDHVVHEELTDKQRTVLRAAFLSGYFEWPRGSTAEELAASMEISSPTLHNHLRKAQQKLLMAVFSDTSGGSLTP